MSEIGKNRTVLGDRAFSRYERAMATTLFLISAAVLSFASSALNSQIAKADVPTAGNWPCLERIRALMALPKDPTRADYTFLRARVDLPHTPSPRGADFFMPSAGEITLSTFTGKQAVSVGSSRGPGVHEIFFRNQGSADIDNQFLVFMDVLRKGAIRDLRENQMGIVLHIDSWNGPSQIFQVLDGSRFAKPVVQKNLTSAQKSLPEDFRAFVLEQYRERLKIPMESLARLRSISEATQQRSVYFIKTREGYFRTKEGSWIRLTDEGVQGVPDFVFQETKLPEHFTFEGGIIAVVSTSETELLPLEMFTGFRVPRPENAKIVEIGRYAVRKHEVTPVSPHLVEQIAATVAGQGDVAKIVIEVDEAHARLFSKIGFKSIHRRKNYNSEVDHIMEIDPHTLLDSVLERNYPGDSLQLFFNDEQRIAR